MDRKHIVFSKVETVLARLLRSLTRIRNAPAAKQPEKFCRYWISRTINHSGAPISKVYCLYVHYRLYKAYIYICYIQPLEFIDNTSVARGIEIAKTQKLRNYKVPFPFLLLSSFRQIYHFWNAELLSRNQLDLESVSRSFDASLTFFVRQTIPKNLIKNIEIIRAH